MTNLMRWVHEQLKAQAIEPIGEIIDVRDGALISTVKKINTSQGMLYIKQPLTVLAHEVPLTNRLAQWFPANIPQVIASDNTIHGLILQDAGLTVRHLTEADSDTSRWEQLLRDYAHIQQATIHRIDDLLALGTPDQRLDMLPAYYRQLLEFPDLLLASGDMSEADLTELHDFAPQVEMLCQQLATYKIPATLHHDDFHANNVIMKDNRYIFIDWGESAVSHPFCSVMLFLRYMKFVFKYDEEQCHRLRDIYLSEWATYGDIEWLRNVFDLSARMQCLNRAVTYFKIANSAHLDDRPEAFSAVTYWLMKYYQNTVYES